MVHSRTDSFADACDVLPLISDECFAVCDFLTRWRWLKNLFVWSQR